MLYAEGSRASMQRPQYCLIAILFSIAADVPSLQMLNIILRFVQVSHPLHRMHIA